MALATTTTPGSIILAGDLTGVANTPELRVTGVIPGTYHSANLVVDTKGRVVYIEDGFWITPPEATTTEVGALYLASDLAGIGSTPQLSATGVTAGTYNAANLTVDSKGRISAISVGSFIDATSSDIGYIKLAGDLSGTSAVPQLVNTGITAGSYTYADFTINDRGLITAIANGTGILPDATNLVLGVIKIAGDLTGTSESPSLLTLGSPLTNSLVSSLTINSKGFVTGYSTDFSTYTATTNDIGLLKLDKTTGTSQNLRASLTGPATAPALYGYNGSGSGTYYDSSFTVNPQGFIRSITSYNGGGNWALATPTTIGVISALAGGAGDFDIMDAQVNHLVLKTVTSLISQPEYESWPIHTFNVANITVDAKGRITNASDGVTSIPNATSTIFGTIKLAGDLMGMSGLPELNNDGFTSGSFECASFTVDSKGRITNPVGYTLPNATTTVVGGIRMLGKFLGSTYDNPQLTTTGVTAGSYTAANIDVVDDGLIHYVTNGTVNIPSSTNLVIGGIQLTNDLAGTANSPSLSTTGISAGTYDFPDLTVDSKGRITAIANGVYNPTTLDATTTTKGMIQLAGDFTGTSISPVLSTTGITAGSYTNADITVSSTGRITSVANGTISAPSDSTYTTKGKLSVTQNTGLTLASGVLSGTMASGTTVYGVVKSANTNNVSITSGIIDIGSNVPKLDSSNTFTKAIRTPILTLDNTSGTTNVDLSLYNAVIIKNTTSQSTLTFSNGIDGQPFKIILDGYSYPLGGQSDPYTQGKITYTVNNASSQSLAYSSGLYKCVLYDNNTFQNVLLTSTDGLNWTVESTSAPTLRVISTPSSGIIKYQSGTTTINCTDGTNITIPAQQVNSSAIYRDGNTWLLIKRNNSSSIYGSYSTNNGSTWNSYSATVNSWDDSASKLLRLPDRWVLLSGTHQSVRAYYSTDGVNWTATGSYTNSDSTITSIAATNNGSRIVVIYSKTRLMYSDDYGANWTLTGAILPTETGEDSKFDIIWTGLEYVIISVVGTNSYHLIKSSNLLSGWTTLFSNAYQLNPILNTQSPPGKLIPTNLGGSIAVLGGFDNTSPYTDDRITFINNPGPVSEIGGTALLYSNKQSYTPTNAVIDCTYVSALDKLLCTYR